MRIRVLQKPTQPSIDGIRLDVFLPSFIYDVGTLLASLMLAEGWAEPASSDDANVVIPLRDYSPALHRNPPNLIREIFPSYYDTPAAFAADRRRTPRSVKRPKDTR